MTIDMAHIAVLGLGNWGTAIARLWLLEGHKVTGWTIEQEVYESITMNETNEKYLPHHPVPGLDVTMHLAEALEGADNQRRFSRTSGREFVQLHRVARSVPREGRRCLELLPDATCPGNSEGFLWRDLSLPDWHLDDSEAAPLCDFIDVFTSASSVSSLGRSPVEQRFEKAIGNVEFLYANDPV